MNIHNRHQYLKIVNDQLNKAQKRLDELEEARNTSESAMTSRYDTQRETLAREASAQMDLVERIQAFQKFIETCGPNTTVEEGAEFKVDFPDLGDAIDRALYCPILIPIEGIQIITPKSPIGSKIRGSRDGDNFTYQAGNNQIKGIINNLR